MTQTTTFDPAQYKADLRTEWRNAAQGWRAWLEVLEAADGGQAVSRSLVELARIGPGDEVLDVAAGYGEPGLTAARAVAPGGAGWGEAGRLVQDVAAYGLCTPGRQVALRCCVEQTAKKQQLQL